jgi:hypothetical protein
MCKSKKVAKMTAKRRSVCKAMDMMMSDSGSGLNAGFVGATGRCDFAISLGKDGSEGNVLTSVTLELQAHNVDDQEGAGREKCQ